MPGVSQDYVDPHLLPRVSLGFHWAESREKSDYLALAQLPTVGMDGS